jgi:fluoroquinolone transport system ATP-binding protein
VIEVEGLTFRYGAGEPAVRDVGFTVGAGEIFGFLGPSGAGKSTTQKVLIGLLRPYEGDVRVLGQDLRSYGPEYYERIGVGFELPNHFVKLSAIENLRFFASFYRSAADPMDLLARVGLEEHATQRVEGFSKGMKMRLNFVRALLHDPDVLFLDEPTSGLDPANARALKDMVVEQRERGKCIVLTTHNMHDADELCDRVAFLVDGRVERLGTPAELKDDVEERAVRVEYRDGEAVASATFGLDGLGDDEDFLALLRERDVVSVHSQEQTLEDVFLTATGRRLS